LPNMIKNNIQIKITLPTNIWSMITMQFFEPWQNLKHHKNSHWKPQTLMKKSIIFLETYYV
jgi:hypothetical protein